MRRLLTLHPDSRCEAVDRIEVEAVRTGPGALDLRFVLIGELDRLRLPPPAQPQRTDGLWRHTCFEAFVRGPAEAYCELNFAPSTEWAAYRFDGYRQGMAPADIGAPRIEAGPTAHGFELRAWVDLAGLPPDAPWRLGLSTVVEEADGRISYWALAHPPGRADFHHADCFALELPATGRP